MAYQKDDRYRTVLKYLKMAIDITRGERTKHDLSRDILKTLIKNEPNLTAYEIIKKLSFDIAQQNLDNKMALFCLYQMLAYCANQSNDIDNAVSYSKRAFDNLLQANIQRNLFNSDYVEIFTRDNNCGKCYHLSNLILAREEILINNPLPPEGCTSEYSCSASYITMSKRLYLRRLEENN